MVLNRHPARLIGAGTAIALAVLVVGLLRHEPAVSVTASAEQAAGGTAAALPPVGKAGAPDRAGTAAANDHDGAGQDELPISVVLDERFRLLDQDGVTRTAADLKGQPTLVFFGYANCTGVCIMALPSIGEATRILESKGATVRPLLVTIDPARDTPAALKTALAKYHPRYVGLTGDEAALAAVRALFRVHREVLFEDPNGVPIYRHGTYVYLFDAEAKLRTVFPPILHPEEMARIVGNYL